VQVANRAAVLVKDDWQDASNLRQNLLGVLVDQMLVEMNRKQYERGTQLVSGQINACRADSTCSQNLEAVYQNWYADAHNQGNWPVAREALQQCVASLPTSTYCKDSLTDLESRHRF
jgi:hypothetical protein